MNVHLNRARLYEKLNKLEESAAAYLDLARLDPDRLEAHQKAAGAYLELGKFKEAVEPFQQAILLAPTDAALRYDLGICYSNLNQKAAAMAQHDALKKLDPARADELLFIIED